jgi:hypothetical protein
VEAAWNSRPVQAVRARPGLVAAAIITQGVVESAGLIALHGYHPVTLIPIAKNVVTAALVYAKARHAAQAKGPETKAATEALGPAEVPAK